MILFHSQPRGRSKSNLQSLPSPVFFSSIPSYNPNLSSSSPEHPFDLNFHVNIISSHLSTVLLPFQAKKFVTKRNRISTIDVIRLYGTGYAFQLDQEEKEQKKTLDGIMVLVTPFSSLRQTALCKHNSLLALSNNYITYSISNITSQLAFHPSAKAANLCPSCSC